MAHTNSSQTAAIPRSVAFVALAVVLTVASGCGDSDQPELGLVSGTVTLDGAPLNNVAITFVPDDGRPAMGKTDFDGTYQLTYIRDTLGCKLGHNRVQIGNTDETEMEMSLEEELGLELEGDELDQEPTKQGSSKSAPGRIPARYNTKSELEANVQPGENTFDFNLSSES